MKSVFPSSVALLVLALLPVPAGEARTPAVDSALSTSSSSISGEITLFNRGKKKRLNSRDLENAVVYFEPARPVAVQPLPEPVVMGTRNKAFEPGVVAVTRGTTVRFPNQDPILHNVFSVTPGNRFDLGFYQKGPGKEYTFNAAGPVRVFCNVHYQMTGHVLVLDTPYFTSPEASGHFRLEGLPAGKGKLTVWHERTDPVSIEVEVPARAPVSVELEVARPRLVPHNNKFGKPYQRRGSGNRYD